MARDLLDQLFEKYECSTEMIERINQAGFSQKERDDLYKQLNSPSQETKKSVFLLKVITAVLEKEKQKSALLNDSEPNATLDNAFIKATQPVIGRALAQEVYAYLVENAHYPELKDPQLQEEYADYLSEIQANDIIGKNKEQEQFAIIGATLKLAKIKELEASFAGNEDFFDYGKYRDFQIMMERTLPIIQIYAQDACYKLSDPNLSEEQRFQRASLYYDGSNPLTFARSLLYNEFPQREDSNHQNAREMIYGITHSVGKEGLRNLQNFIEQAKRASAFGAHVVINEPNYRKLSPEERQKTIRTAVLGIESADSKSSQTKLPILKTGGRNG